MTNFFIIVGAIVTAYIVSTILAVLAMSNGRIMKWFMKRYFKMFEDFTDEELF